MTNHSSVFRYALAFGAILLVATFALGDQSASAATFIVTKTLDTADGTCDADCSLREAIIAANAAAGTDTITIPAGTYIPTLVGTGDDAAATGDLDITDGVTLNGASASTTIIDGNGIADRIFDHDALGLGITSVFNDITIRNGGDGSTPDGAGIDNNDVGNLTLNNVTVSDNNGDDGSGIDNNDGTLTVNNSTFSNNATDTSDDGGAIRSSGTLVVTNSIFTNNSADVEGGAIAVTGGSATISGSTFTGNDALTGGAISFGGNGTVTNSTFSGNTAIDFGGAIYNESVSLWIEGSTLNGNSADDGGGLFNADSTDISNTTISGNTADFDGGGVYHGADVGHLSLANVTIFGNTAGLSEGVGGGVYSGGGAPLNVKNTIIAGNIDADCYGPLNSGGYNLIQNTIGCIITNFTTGNITGQSPNLGALANNGGATQTHALQAGSPAIDTANPAVCEDYEGGDLTTDQRGSTRPVDGDANGSVRCDIGAYELHAPATPSPSPTTAPTPSPSPTPTQAPIAFPPTGSVGSSGPPVGLLAALMTLVIMASIATVQLARRHL
jgi:CSLREA domain-containing protein